jgi:fructose-bisphosphate aldolase class I
MNLEVLIVEPEVLIGGNHSMEECFEVTEEVLRTVFRQLYKQRVTPEGIIILLKKRVMNLSGSNTQQRRNG